MSQIPLSYFQQSDVVALSRELLGKELHTSIDGEHTAGIIIETEAYAGPEDRASHAYNNHRTARTEVMFGEGGRAYVYLCYGIHPLFNIVTHSEGIPHAILIRALHPTLGLETMKRRRKGSTNLCSGPGTLSQAMGITLKMNGTPLDGPTIWVEEGVPVEKKAIEALPRVGIDYAGPDALLPWRFKCALPY